MQDFNWSVKIRGTLKKAITSIVSCWHQDMTDVPLATAVEGIQEHKSRLVNGFSAIKPRGIENSGTIPSSF